MIYVGAHITLGDSLIITVFSMLIVFVALVLIAYLIRILKVIAIDDKDKGKNKADSIKPKPVESNPIEAEISNRTEDDEELVAAIAAAIAASLGVDIPQIRIRKIKRLPQNTPIWAEAGRMEQIRSI